MRPGNNPVEKVKAEKDGLDILEEIEELAANHGGWETLDPGDRDRLKWIGTFFRKPTPGQLRTLAEIARRLGNGTLDITTRQQIQLRAIKIGAVPEILEALQGVDLNSFQTGMDNIRGVNCCPLSGLTAEELFDAAPVGAEYTGIFLKNKEFTNLPRKFNVTITGCLENCTHGETQDLGMFPAVRESDSALGFNVSVGGKMGSGGMVAATHLDIFVEPHEAARLAVEITLLFRDEGARERRTKTRLAFMTEEWGAQRFRAALEERWGKPLSPAGRDARGATKTDHLGVNAQSVSGLSSVGLCVPTGRTSADQIAALASLAETYGSGEVRLTTSQNAIIVNVPDDKLSVLLAEPLLRDLSPNPHPFARGLVTCTGTDYCNLALIETKGAGKRIADILAKKYPKGMPLTMHWSGCPSGCGNHQAADIGFQGAKARVDGGGGGRREHLRRRPHGRRPEARPKGHGTGACGHAGRGPPHCPEQL